jgi:hypothetical protein
MIKNIKDIVILSLTSGILILLGVINTQFRMNWAPPPEVKETIKTTYQQNERIAVLEKHIEMQEQQIQDTEAITLMRMSITGLIGIIAGYIGGKN